MIVRREERDSTAVRMIVKKLDDRPRQREAIEGCRAASNFVEDDQRSIGGVVENVGGFVHLDHERRFAPRELVRRADAREDAIEDAQSRGGGRDETAGLIEQHDQRDLPKIGRLAAHIGSRDDLNAVAIANDVAVVRNEALAGDRFDHRMAAVLDHDLRCVAQRRAHISVPRGHRRK